MGPEGRSKGGRGGGRPGGESARVGHPRRLVWASESSESSESSASFESSASAPAPNYDAHQRLVPVSAGRHSGFIRTTTARDNDHDDGHDNDYDHDHHDHDHDHDNDHDHHVRGSRMQPRRHEQTTNVASPSSPS